MNYKTGDKVRIVKEGIHFFSKGSIVEVVDPPMVGAEHTCFGDLMRVTGYVDLHPEKPYQGEQGLYSEQVEPFKEPLAYAVGWAK